MKGKKEEKQKFLCSNCNGVIEGVVETCPHCGAYFDPIDN